MQPLSGSLPIWILMILLILLSFALSVAATALVRSHLKRRLIDRPNQRSSHSEPTPTGGGLGFLAAFGLCSLVLVGIAREPAAAALLPALALLLPLAAIGLVDDGRGAARSSRILVQLGVSAALVSLYGPFPLLEEAPTLLSFALCTLAATAVINFYNFMDGIDGLVAGCTATQLLFWARWQDQPLWWLLAAALAGFLIWNWSPARIFMGDVGSTVLGALVVVALLDPTATTRGSWEQALVALPLVGDAAYTLLRRLVRGENVFVAHHSHIYQRMIRAGRPPAQIATLYVVLTAGMALVVDLLGRPGVLVGALIFAAFVITAEWTLARKRVPFTVHDTTVRMPWRHA